MLRLIGVFLVFVLSGCSTHTTMTLADGSDVRAELASGGAFAVPITGEIDHPGDARMGVGAALITMGAAGHAALSVIAGQSSSSSIDPESGLPSDDYEGGCEMCVIGLPGTLTTLSFGVGLLFHGLALRRESMWQLEGGSLGIPHQRIGRALLAVGLVSMAGIPMVFANRNSIAGGGFALIGLTPGFMLTGIALLVRGARLRRGENPQGGVTANGIVFDLSL